MSTSSLTQRAGRSALWQLAGGGWQTIVRLSASVFLARALAPSDFGLVGIAMLVYMFLSNLGAAGMGTGIIVKKEASDVDLCTCFWSMAAMRFVMFLIAFLGAPLAAYFFNDPRLTDVIRVISFTFLISILSAVSQTLLTKEFKFKALNIIRGVTAVLESGTALFLALTTSLGYWALVIGMLAHALGTHLLVFVTVSWKPKLKFDKESFWYLFRYGINGLGSSLTNYFRQNLDYILVGKLLGTHTLGLYEFAYRIPHLVNGRVSRPVGAVILPTLSKLQDDNYKLARGCSQAVKYMALITFPMLFGLAAVADVAVLVLWGEQWVSIITPLRILCVCAAMRIIAQPSTAIFNTLGRPDLSFKISIVSLVWTAIVVSGLGYIYGLVGVAIGMMASTFPGVFSLYLAFKKLDKPSNILVYSIFPIVISSLACSLSALFVSISLQQLNIHLIYVLIAAIITGSIVYVMMFNLIFKRDKYEFFDYLEQIIGVDLKTSGIRKALKFVH